MKKAMLFLLCSCAFQGLSAQTITTDEATSNRIAKLANQDSLEQARLECIYLHTTHDPALNETRKVYEMLQTGKLYSKYWDYNYYRIDSVLNCKDRQRTTVRECNRLWSQYGPVEGNFVLSDLYRQELLYCGTFFGGSFLYKESLPTFEWQLEDERREICGHVCRKATTKFRGRTWVAWYAEKILVKGGPWKLRGLPGLILKAGSADGEHDMEAVVLRKHPQKSPIVYERINYLLTTRERFNRSEADYHWNTRQYLTGHPLAPRESDGREITRPIKRMFYNPLEKE